MEQQIGQRVCTRNRIAGENKQRDDLDRDDLDRHGLRYDVMVLSLTVVRSHHKAPIRPPVG